MQSEVEVHVDTPDRVRARQRSAAGQVAGLEVVQVEDRDVVVDVRGQRGDVVDVIVLAHQRVPEPVGADRELDRGEVGRREVRRLHTRLAVMTEAEVLIDRALPHVRRQHIGEHDLLVVLLGQLASLGVTRAAVDEVVVEGGERSGDLGEDLVLVIAWLDQERLAGLGIAAQVEHATVAGHRREAVRLGRAQRPRHEEMPVIGGIQLRVGRRSGAEHVVEIEPEALEVGQRARVHVCRRLRGLVEIEVVVDELAEIRVLGGQRGAVVRGPAVGPRRVGRTILHRRSEIGCGPVGVVERRQAREHRPEARRGLERGAVDASAGAGRETGTWERLAGAHQAERRGDKCRCDHHLRCERTLGRRTSHDAAHCLLLPREDGRGRASITRRLRLPSEPSALACDRSSE